MAPMIKLGQSVCANALKGRVCWLTMLAALVGAITLASVGSAPAVDTIRVGKASATTFAFAPLEIGTEKGIWARHGLAVESIAFGGDARLQQAMVANSIDFSLGSGPG